MRTIEKPRFLCGASLAASNLLCFVFWLKDRYQVIFQDAVPRVCWPFFPWCDTPLLTSRLFASSLYAGLLLFSLLAFYALFTGRERQARWLLAAGFLSRLLLYLLDFRLFGNYHLIPFFLAAAYFVSPARGLFAAVLVGCYFFAGLLKWNVDWLSGQALTESQRGYVLDFLLGGPEALRLLVLSSVIALENVLSLGLLFFPRKMRLAALFLFACFHLISWDAVGFFYPLSMLGFLAALIPGAKPIAQEGFGKTAIAFLAGFVALQLYPIARFPQRSVTGEGRWYSLSMYDSALACRGEIELDYGTHRLVKRLDFRAQGVRIACDPYLYFHAAKGACAENAEKPEFRDLKLRLISKRPSETRLRPVINIENFCRADLRYSIWNRNSWILPQD